MTTTPEPTEPPTGSAAEPFTVDLSQLTPSPAGATPIIQPTPGSPGVDPVVARVIEQLHADLARYLNVDSAEIAFVEVQPTVWQSDNLGCPQADDGAAIEGAIAGFHYQEQRYNYHLAPGRYILCIDGNSVSGGVLQ